MSFLRDLPGVTLIEQKDAVFLMADDNFCIKAIYKPKSVAHTFDWRFIEETDDFVPKIPQHFMLRKLVSDHLNEKKLKKRPIWKKGATE